MTSTAAGGEAVVGAEQELVGVVVVAVVAVVDVRVLEERVGWPACWRKGPLVSYSFGPTWFSPG